MLRMSYFLQCFLVISYSLICSWSQHVIRISSSGHDDRSCLHSTNQPCHTLEYVSCHLKQVSNNSIVIEISETGINLTKSVSFVDFKGLSIIGEGGASLVTIFCSSSGAGLEFVNVSGVSLRNVNLTGCGSARNVRRFDTPLVFIQLSALSLINCSNVSITDSILFRSNGSGLSLLDTTGAVTIVNTSIAESYIQSQVSNTMYGGNGFAVEFTANLGRFEDGYRDCNSSERNIQTTYTITNCTFSSNQANAGESITANFSHSWKNTGCLGSGGGMCVSLGGNTTQISVFIESCKVHNNSAVVYGGGTKIQFLDTSHDNRLALTGTSFSHNRALKGKMGGGFQLVFSYFVRDTNPVQGCVRNTTVTFEQCSFTNNSATNGGGINIFSGEVTMDDNESAIRFVGCNWTENTATLYGSAVHIMPGVWASRNQGRYPALTFNDSIFSRNKLVPNITHSKYYETQQNGAGAFLTNVLKVSFCGATVFENNNGTALYLSGSVASFCPASNVLFDSNNGTNGGAVSLIGQSYLYVDEKSNFTFTGNRARDVGGAIYFHSTESKVHQICFIYRDLIISRSSFKFYHNYAGSKRGNHIFVSSVIMCNLYCPEKSMRDFYECIGNFEFVPTINATATMPTKFAVNTNDTLILSPGIPLKLPLLVSDFENNNVSNISYQASLMSEYSDMCVDPAFRYVSADTISVTGKERENGTLRLDDLASGVSILVEIALDDCPPGYVINSENKCECHVSQYYGLWNCDPVYVLYGVWIGACGDSNSSHLCTSDCPAGYCTHHKTNIEALQLPSTTSKLEETICSSTRTGTRCGECKPGHSVYYNSPNFDCGPDNQCYLGAVYFILSTVLPLAILLVVIMLFDTNFASGWNSFMLFAQIVCSLYVRGYGSPKTQLSVLNWLLFIYNFFNLELFNVDLFSFCIWREANVMDVLMVKLGSICIALILVIAVVLLLMQPTLFWLFPFISRRRYSVINSISAFLILCYAQCAKTCFQVLYTGCLFDKDGSCDKSVVFYWSDTIPFHGGHLKYAAIALVFLVIIVIIPPALLLFYPLFFNVLGRVNLSESRPAMFLWRLMPIQLLDSLQNPFKDEYRFFAGLHFLYRIVPLVVYAATKNMMQVYAFTEVSLVLMIVVLAAFQPYKKRLHNIIDLLLLFNLTLVNSITTYSYTAIMIGIKETMFWWGIAQLCLLLLPLIVAVGILVAKCFIRLNGGCSTSTQYTNMDTLSYSFGAREE